MKKIKFCVVMFFVFLVPQAAYCVDSKYEASFAYGKRSQSDALDEESAFGEFHYIKHAEKFRQNYENFGYDASYSHYDKDYKKSRDYLSSWTHDSHAGVNGLLWKNDANSFKFNTDFDCRIKRFERNPTGEYDRLNSLVRLDFEGKDSYAISGTYGIENYHFVERDSEELSQIGKVGIKKYFFDKKLSLSSSYKLKYRDRQSGEADKIENMLRTGIDIKKILPYLDLLKLNLELGEDNTRSYFDEDEYYDFKYIKWYAKTEHELTDFLSSSLKFEQYAKDYNVFNHDYISHKIDNDWQWDIYKIGDSKVFFQGGYGFRYMDYEDAKSMSYRKHSFKTEIGLNKKKDFNALIGFKWSDDDYYKRRSSDKTSFTYSASVEKDLLKNNLTVFADYKYKHKYYHHREDINENTIEAGLKGKF